MTGTALLLLPWKWSSRSDIFCGIFSLHKYNKKGSSHVGSWGPLMEISKAETNQQAEFSQGQKCKHKIFAQWLSYRLLLSPDLQQNSSRLISCFEAGMHSAAAGKSIILPCSMQLELWQKFQRYDNLSVVSPFPCLQTFELWWVNLHEAVQGTSHAGFLEELWARLCQIVCPPYTQPPEWRQDMPHSPAKQSHAWIIHDMHLVRTQQGDADLWGCFNLASCYILLFHWGDICHWEECQSWCWEQRLSWYGKRFNARHALETRSRPLLCMSGLGLITKLT